MRIIQENVITDFTKCFSPRMKFVFEYAGDLGNTARRLKLFAVLKKSRYRQCTNAGQTFDRYLRSHLVTT